MDGCAFLSKSASMCHSHTLWAATVGHYSIIIVLVSWVALWCLCFLHEFISWLEVDFFLFMFSETAKRNFLCNTSLNTGNIGPNYTNLYIILIRSVYNHNNQELVEDKIKKCHKFDLEYTSFSISAEDSDALFIYLVLSLGMLCRDAEDFPINWVLIHSFCGFVQGNISSFIPQFIFYIGIYRNFFFVTLIRRSLNMQTKLMP